MTPSTAPESAPESAPEPEPEVQPSPYVARLPIGVRLPTPEMAYWEIFPIEGDLQVKLLEPPVLPEPARNGDPGGDECWTCGDPDKDVIWRDEHWQVRQYVKPTGLPAVVTLFPNAHHDLEDLPDDLAAEFGLMIRRVARAVQSLDGIARVHVNRWGDGSAHLHVWFLPRPLGMRQMRGACLAIWDDLLPPMPADEWLDNLRRIATALAADGGTAFEPSAPPPAEPDAASG
ncbi:MAG: hypothetical protein L0Y54_20725 [Sporichthyaceae bacterium]|nr:hypothetical protein [Sporichthyaceae bacterium]